MADCDISFAQLPQALRCENFSHESHITAGRNDTIVVNRDTGALLTAVLQGIERIIGEIGQIAAMRREDAENAALLMQS